MRIARKEKDWMGWALGVFALETLVIVVLNALRHGWQATWSISYYVGLETWSAVLFALGNVVVAACLGKYLYAVGKIWRLPRWYYCLVVLMGVSLLGLSVCPLGYFARRGLEMVDVMHKICSRVMFVSMFLLALMYLMAKPANRVSRLLVVILLAYGAIVGTAYAMGIEWMVQAEIFYESAYIFGFMGLCLALQTKGGQHERRKS